MDEAAKLRDRAAKAWSKGNWSAAAEAYEDLFRLEPRNLMHKLRAGDSLVKLGKTKEAIATYAQLAERYAAEGMLIRAISVNKLILQLDPMQKDTQKRLAALYSKRGVATVAARAASVSAASAPEPEAPSKKRPDMDLPDVGESEMVIETAGGQTQPVSGGTRARPSAIPLGPEVGASPAGASPSPSSDPQTLAAEVIDLGPADEVSHSAQPSNVASAVAEAKAALKESGSDVDLDSLFADVGEIPQVPPTPLFSDLQPAEFERMIELLAPIRVPEGTDICRESEPANSMFVIAQGAVQVYFTDEAGVRVPLAKLVEGDFFGEFALFEGGVRKASVESLEETELLELSKENFDLVCAEFPAAAGVIRMFYYARLADTFLAKSSIFGSLAREARWDFVRRMTLQRYNAGQPILREGDGGDALFMIRTGSVRIFSGAGADAVKLAELPAGEIFGEIAVISLQPRTANVVAASEVELYRLDRESARRMLATNATIAGKVKEIAEARVRNTIDAMITGSVGNTGR